MVKKYIRHQRRHRKNLWPIIFRVIVFIGRVIAHLLSYWE